MTVSRKGIWNAARAFFHENYLRSVCGGKEFYQPRQLTANRTFQASKLKHHFEKYQNRKCINSDEHVDDDESDFADEDIVQEASLVVCK